MGDLPRESQHENIENPTFTRRQQTFITGGARRGSYKSCNGLPLNISQCHNNNTHTAIPAREDRQPVPMMVAGEEDDLSSPLVQQSSGEHQC
jgi:hypothetical protein